MDPKKRYRLSVLGVGIGFLALGWMNLSLHSEEVLALAARFNAAQLSPLHFREAVEDWLADL